MKASDYRIQLPLALISLTAIWCTLSLDPLVRAWGPVFGLASQPFWFIATYQARQWGMFLLACAYTAVWMKGIVTFWF